MSIKIVGFLQNAWSPLYAGGTWPRQSWLRALERSRSGQRLRILTDGLNETADWWFDNTTPIVGKKPSSKLPPDLNHIFRVLDEQKPDYIVGFGKQARESLDKIIRPAKTWFVPHPAHRTLTNDLYEDLVRLIKEGMDKEDEYVALIQERKNCISYEFGQYIPRRGYVCMSR